MLRLLLAGTATLAAPLDPSPVPNFNFSVQAWLRFAGIVLVIAVINWAQAVLVPVAIALLLTFLLALPVARLQRLVGRAAAVTTVVTLTFAALSLVAWGLAHQLGTLVDSLPHYRDNIREKIADVRAIGSGGTLDRLQNTVEDIQREIDRDAQRTAAKREAAPVVVTDSTQDDPLGLPDWIESLLAPLGMTALVTVLVIFMLLEREELRSRLIHLVGHGNVPLTTKALTEAGRRVSRYLLSQSLINVGFGFVIGLGLTLIGVPQSWLWGAFATVMRFIPYAGPWIAASAPLLVSLAALPGWRAPAFVLVLFAATEFVTNVIVETFVNAGAAGVSQVVLLVAIAFWTWLWGLPGLLLATPLTVCLVVLGKHVRGLEFLATLMADRPPINPAVNYYQRLLAHDQAEALDCLDVSLKSESRGLVYDTLMIPALVYARRDRIEERLTREEEQGVVEATAELFGDLRFVTARDKAANDGESASAPTPPLVATAQVLGLAANDTSDALALAMLRDSLQGTGIELDVPATRLSTNDAIARLRGGDFAAACIVDLPPGEPSRSRYFVRRLHAALPNLRILVGRWAPSELRDDTTAPLVDAGAAHVAGSLEETRNELLESFAAPAASDERRAVR